MADLGGLQRPETRPPGPETAGGLGAPETAPEAREAVELTDTPEEVEQVVERAAVEEERVAAAPTPVVPAAPAKDPVLTNVERVLEEGLEDTYMALGPADRAKFRAGGERAAVNIRQMLGRGHLKLKEIWKIIRDWLRTIPGASRFFIEQEAKIKTDRIIRLAEKQKRR